MSNCKYYKQQKYVSYDSGTTWSPLQEFRRGAFIESDSQDCGYITEYRWVDVVGEYTCSGCTKYQKTKKQVTHDGTTWEDVIPLEYSTGAVIEQSSEDCGCGAQYRWYQLPSTEYICIGTTKYYKEIYQVSNDGGQTWTNVVPEQTRASGVIEEESSDCGSIQPIERWIDGTMCDDCESYKVINYTSGETMYVQCGNATVTSGEITNRTTISSSTIGNCATAIGNGAFSGCTIIESVRIPNTVTSIGDSAFQGCQMLLDASIPDSVTSIGANAFSGCTQLCFVSLPNYLTTLGNGAFRNCLNFSSINIPLTLASIPEDCFRNCDGLADVELHSGITSIGSYAFYACDSLFNIYCYATTPPTLGYDALYKDSPQVKIYVPPASLDVYKSAWSDYASKIYPIT